MGILNSISVFNYIQLSAWQLIISIYPLPLICLKTSFAIFFQDLSYFVNSGKFKWEKLKILATSCLGTKLQIVFSLCNKGEEISSVKQAKQRMLLCKTWLLSLVCSDRCQQSVLYLMRQKHELNIISRTTRCKEQRQKLHSEKKHAIWNYSIVSAKIREAQCLIYLHIKDIKYLQHIICK